MTKMNGPLFIVGNSRSGTTMLGAMFGQHSDVHTFDELHFFEQMVDTDTIAKRPEWDEDQLLPMLERLITSSREGLFATMNAGTYAADAKAILARASRSDPITVYETFLRFESARSDANVPCEQTPRYLYQAEEILASLPSAHMVCIVRDPRSVLLSQKNRWKRSRLSAGTMPFLWTARSWSNYHPFTTSLMWAAASRRTRAFDATPRFHIIQYETLLRHPEKTMRDLCTATGLPYEPDMLNVERIGSSSVQDRPQERGVDVSRIDAWQAGGLTAAEISLCEKVTAKEMIAWGYPPSDTKANVLTLGGIMISFVFKSATALALNFRRFKNLGETIRRRLT